ncbi:MAG TPA: MFS transporter [Solirubrobacteraceae bacterium]|nr:MFS transporter [Solirubrobacteraceae bacterium]
MLGVSGARRRLPQAMQDRDFALFILVVLAMNLASQMIAVAIGWQVYDIRHRAFDLGLIGLLEFAPVFLLALPAGTLTDRVARRLVLGIAAVLLVAVAASLIVVSAAGAHELWPFLALASASGTATALFFPATRALPGMLVDRDLLPSALAIRSVGAQTAMVAGPALGGVLFTLSPEVVYGTALGLFALAVLALAAMRVRANPSLVAASQLERMLGGIRFIGRTPILLGVILLDLLAVLFGGAVALLPVFAQTILHTGPAGLGLLRSAPAVGAVAGGILLIRRPLPTAAGPTMIFVVSLFGASMIAFGLSHWMVLSLAALAISGAADIVSVNIRTTTATMITPDEVRGRVGSVEAVFVGASNQLGAFESGTAAALLGAVPAVVAGGAVTILIALGWTRLFPDLAKLGRLSELGAADDPAAQGVSVA